MSKGEAGLSRKIIFNMWVSAAVYNFQTEFLVHFPLPCCECSSLSFAFKELVVLMWAQGVSLWPAALISFLAKGCTQVSGFGCSMLVSFLGWGAGLSLYCMWPHGLAIRFCCTSHGGFVGWKATYTWQMCPISLFQCRVMSGIDVPDARETALGQGGQGCCSASAGNGSKQNSWSDLIQSLGCYLGK